MSLATVLPAVVPSGRDRPHRGAGVPYPI